MFFCTHGLHPWKLKASAGRIGLLEACMAFYSFRANDI